MSTGIRRGFALAVGVVVTFAGVSVARAAGPRAPGTFVVCGRNSTPGTSHCIGLQQAIDKATTMAENITIEMLPGAYCPPTFPASNSIYWYRMDFVGIGLSAYRSGGSFTGPEALLTTISWAPSCGAAAPSALVEMTNQGANTGAISLRNLTVDGSGGGLVGVHMANASVGLRDVIVRNFDGAGVEVESSSTAYHSAITSSAIVHNSGIGAYFGGMSTGSIDQSTVADNGTGVAGSAAVSLLNDTIARNGTGFSSAATSQVVNTINAGNTTADCSGSGWESGTGYNGYNLTGNSCVSQHASGDLLFTGTIGHSAAHGGPTYSVTPPTQAVGAGSNGGCSSSTTTGNPLDQREYRITDTQCDIGSVAVAHVSATPQVETFPARNSITDLGLGTSAQPTGTLVTVSSSGGSLVHVYDVSVSGTGFSLTYDGCSLQVLVPVPTQYCQVGVQAVASAAHPRISGVVIVHLSTGDAKIMFRAHGLHAGSLAAPRAATIAYGTSRTFSTRLTDTTAHSVVHGVKVVLQARRAGSATYTTVTARITSNAGTATVTVRPKVNTAYRWHYAGSRTRYPSTSSAAVVAVAQVVTARLASTSVPSNAKVTVTGSVTPTSSVGTVTLQVLAHGHWLRHGTAPVHGGEYVLHTTFAGHGKHSLRVARAATSTLAGGHSRELTLHTT